MLIQSLETLAFAAQLCSTAIPSLKDNKGPEVDAIVITIMVLATIAVSLRFFARWVSATKYGMDDLLIVFALVSDLISQQCTRILADVAKVITYCMDIMYLTGKFPRQPKSLSSPKSDNGFSCPSRIWTTHDNAQLPSRHQFYQGTLRSQLY